MIAPKNNHSRSPELWIRFVVEGEDSQITDDDGNDDEVRIIIKVEGDEFEQPRLVCAGDLGDAIYWEDGCESICVVQDILSRLDEAGRSEDIPWDELIGEHAYFEPIRTCSFPPLYDVSEFDVLAGFWTEIEEPDPEEDELPGMSFNQVSVTVDETDFPEIQVIFERFYEHLSSLPFLRDAGLVD